MQRGVVVIVAGLSLWLGCSEDDGGEPFDGSGMMDGGSGDTGDEGPTSPSSGDNGDDQGDQGDDQGDDTGDDTGDEGGSASCESEAMFPAPDWPTGDPAAFGLNAAQLEVAAQYAGENKTNCMAIIKDGHLVFERYFMGSDENTKQKSWSVAKSYASTVAGIALERGDLGAVDDSIADYLPQLVGTPKEQITLHHLMAMSSGLYMDLIDDNLGLSSAPDMTAKAIGLEVTNAPGTLWEYNNHAVQLLEPIIKAQTGMDADQYAREHLWDPIGMDAEWLKDEAGQPALYQNVLASCRDHAKFGYLFLHNGCWDGEQIVSEAWVDQATNTSQNMSQGYGYWWWLSGEQPTLDSTDFSELPGGLHPFGPDDSYCAVGLGSQFIEVIPAHDMVVVRMGVAPHDDPLGWLNPLQMIEELLADGKQPVHNGVLERVLQAVQ